MNRGLSILAGQRLDLHYHNVKTLLLDVEIDHVWCFCTEVVELLCTEHSKKIRNLSVHASVTIGPRTFTFGDSITFPHLQSLRLMQSRLQSFNGECLFNAPNLRSLALYASSIAFIFPWNRLHSLTLWDHDAQACLEAISQCTNLRSLSLHPRNTRS
ncbi:hypothetical protein P691DRAFT_811452 [Macrolepiota fuliginosa MF-IS2]|uniref:Uncharacterized protein n=1 Tax=Macrolepiota fuliginosa MF-IS2 TaxID=1400762 RepID=A0A9P5XHJ3_9AGAR|nr:hypothetical protein P691DRAFT_811452 [Macrolepiota fuliginosa MF-IS2]